MLKELGELFRLGEFLKANSTGQLFGPIRGEILGGGDVVRSAHTANYLHQWISSSFIELNIYRLSPKQFKFSKPDEVDKFLSYIYFWVKYSANITRKKNANQNTT